jgi:methyltransferase-like protein/cyclopropane fatty-acyl-phospholipid synthase-like methyltransferase
LGLALMSMTNPYDAVPYPSLSYSQSHPDRLATVARLVGMNPAPVTQCRVLEVGCASGGNLIPMAEQLPHSKFVGIDLSARQIALGQEAVHALGFQNVTLKQLDLMDADESLGEFDYIIAHGVFSWVPRRAQEKLLELCRRNLAPQGVAYISYNVYPGWRLLGAAREMMLYHTRNIVEPMAKARHARELFEFLYEALGGNKQNERHFLRPYINFLRQEREHLQDHQDALLLHDELEEVNDPTYFHQFIARAEKHGLQYACEADFSKVMLSNLPDEVAAELSKLATGLIELEQYMDFVRNNTFRQTLLCHQTVTLTRALRPELASNFYLASRARPETPEPPAQAGKIVKFHAPDGATLAIDHPLSKMAMLCLGQVWPRALSFGELLTLARSYLSKAEGDPGRGECVESTPMDADAHVLAANILKAYTYSNNLVELHGFAPQVMTTASERPMVSAWVRYQAAHETRPKVTNVWHERVSLDELDCFLAQRLDGAHDHATLVDAALEGPIAEGQLVLRDNNEPVSMIDMAATRKLVSQEIAGKLRWFAYAGLLVQ